MTTDPLVFKARALWEELARVPVSFDPEGGVRVVASPESSLCPRGWTGVVSLGGSAIATAPTEAAAAMVGAALSGVAAEAMTNADALGAVLPLDFVLGPATLSYLDPADFRPVPNGDVAVERLQVGHPELVELERASSRQDADEAAINEITSPAFVVRVDGGVVAASGYQTWPRRTAHISILTAPAWRGKGFGRMAASNAVAHALTAGLLPQWRARPIPSRRVAAALGFRELGAQLSFRMAPQDGREPASAPA